MSPDWLSPELLPFHDLDAATIAGVVVIYLLTSSIRGAFELVLVTGAALLLCKGLTRVT